MNEATRFRFDFADLQPPAVELRLIEGGVPVPAEARPVAPRPRPGWLPPLLPMFAEGRGLRIDVARPAAPTFAGVLVEGLTGLLAAAAAGAGVEVVRWQHGFLVGSHGLERMPLHAHVTLVAADLVAASLEMANGLVRLLPEGRTLIVLNGSLPALERVLPLPAVPAFRVPLVGAAELSAPVRDLPPSLGSQKFGRACLALAVEISRRYREQLP